ncbi:MAG: S-layer homology domain-containing protein [Clostridia bacterium]|nr:S-layer homology domain-containing protein [Clostridia bacterium]
MKKILSLVLVLCLLFSQGSFNISFAEESNLNASISGTIALPDGETAPLEGVQVGIQATSTSNKQTYSSWVTISSGTSTKDYSISVPENDSYTIEYFIPSSSQSQYVVQGFYNHGGTSSDYYNAKPVSSGAAGINLRIIKGKLITGKIALPDQDIAPVGGISIKLIVVGKKDISHAISYTSVLTIPEGQRDLEYSVKIASEEGYEYAVGYSIDSNSRVNSKYIKNGYFKDGGMTAYMDKATYLTEKSVLSDINMQVIKGKLISGTVSLPAGEKAPEEGIKVDVFINNVRGLVIDELSSKIIIPAGSDSVEYLLAVPGEDEDKYSICYRITSNDPQTNKYVRLGYYAANGTVAYSSLASRITATDGDIANINLQLIKGKVISGKISLPDENIAPSQGIWVRIEVQERNKIESISNSAIILPGNHYAEYTVAVPDVQENTYSIGYNLYSSDPLNCYFRGGYYSEEGMTADRTEASQISVKSGDVSGIDLQVMKGKRISGKLSLPDGITLQSGGRYISIYCSNTKYSGWGTALLDSSGSAVFEIVVPKNEPNDGYVLSYYSSYNTNRIVAEGYYGGNKSTTIKEKALKIDVSQGDIKGIEFTIIEGKEISGTISLPNNQVAPMEEVVVSIKAEAVDENGKLTGEHSRGMYNVFIPQGKDSTTYSLAAPVLDGSLKYKVSYYILNHNNYTTRYVRGGYYNGSSMTTNKSKAVSVNLQNGDACEVNLKIIEGNVLEGKICLPDGKVAPESGFVFGVLAKPVKLEGSNYTYMDTSLLYNNVYMEKGSNSCVFRIPVEASEDVKNYVLQYVESKGPTEISGTYNTSGTVSDPFQGTVIDLSKGDVSGIQFTALESKTTVPTPTPTTATPPPPANQNTNGNSNPVINPPAATATPTMVPTSSPTPTATAVPTQTPTPTATSTTAATSTPVPVEEPTSEIPGGGGLKDVTGHWAEQSILDLIKRGIVSGYTDGTVRPDAEVTRAEIVKMIVTALGYTPEKNPKLNFKDNAGIPDWVKGYLQVAVDKGIVSGFEDVTFGASNKCSRQEVIVMLMRAFGFGQSDKPLSFADAERIAPWARKYIVKAIEMAIVKGYGDNTLKPDKLISRAEAITLIYKCLNIKKKD